MQAMPNNHPKPVSRPTAPNLVTIFYSQHVTNRNSCNLLKIKINSISTRNTFPLFGFRPSITAPERPSSGLDVPARSFDRYTCRTKNAASPFPSTKRRNLIDTEFAPAASSRLHLRCSCPTTWFETLPISNLRLPTSRPCYVVLRATKFEADSLKISRHVCRDIFRITSTPSTKLRKYRGTFSVLVGLRFLAIARHSRPLVTAARTLPQVSVGSVPLWRTGSGAGRRGGRPRRAASRLCDNSQPPAAGRHA